MRDLGKKTWLAASCGVICLVALSAASLRVTEKQALQPGERGDLPRIAGLNHVTSVPQASAKSAHTAELMKQYGQLPLAFEPSAAAANSPAKYLARGTGYTLFLANTEAVLELRGKSKSVDVVRMELAGANASPKFSAADELPGKSNYLIGNDPTKWRIGVPQYRKVVENNVYPGVDLVYYGTQGKLEYDFDVAPGTNPKVINLAFAGTGDVQIDAQGELVVNTTAGAVRMRKPVAYQEIGNAKRPVQVAYALNGKNRARFEVAKYDSSLPLIIDPILAYSTYLGGSNIDSSNAIAVAPDNTAFIAGGTFSSDFPVVHPLQPDIGGQDDFPQDAFVSKISIDGSTLLYSTYLGGINEDFATGIAVDNAGDAFVTGQTISPGYPTTLDAVNRSCGGDGKCGASWNPMGAMVTNAFISKLNPAGSGLLYSTFLGFYEDVSGEAIAVDANGNAYITGQLTDNITPTVTILPPATPPPPFPITLSAFQTSHGAGTWNAFLTEIDSSGSTILYSSYLGGNTEDIAYGVAVDSTSDAYITGLTYSTNLATTAGALQPAYAGAGDAFVAKVNTNAFGSASLVFLTYLGGTGLDQANGIALDTAGNPYIVGATNSAAFGFVPAGFQPAYAGEGDAFVSKLTTTGALSYFTYLGGSLSDAGNGIAVDSSSNAYVTGTTVSQNFPTAGAVFQPAYGGGNADAFVAKLGPTGTTLLYSSYLGGTNTELATGIAVDTAGDAFVTGQTCSQDFPLANPLQPAPGGNCDAYIAKVSILPGFAFNPAGLVFSAQSLNTTSPVQVITLTNGENAQTITNIAITGANATDFAATNTCPLSIAVGATCTISIKFTPIASGIRKAAVTITDSAPGSPHVLNLSGNTSTVTLSATSLSFGQQAVGIASPVQSVVVTNTGTTNLSFTSITASGDFVEGNNCVNNSLVPGTTCLIQVSYVPSAAVSSVGAITLTDSATGSPQVILTTGTGVLEPVASLSSVSLGFPTEAIGFVSTPQTVMLSNSGQAALNVTSIAVSGDFAQTNNCGVTLAQNTSCIIAITFSPTAAGPRPGSLTVIDNSGNVSGTVQTTSLTGTGQVVAALSLTPNTLSFGSQSVGTTSAPQTVVVKNTGATSISFTSISASGDFASTGNCATSILAPNSTCVILVTFTPEAAAASAGTVVLNMSGGYSPLSISTTGTGVAQALATVTPVSLGFPAQNIGSPSNPQIVTLSNTGLASLNVSSVVATGDFTETNNCGAILAQNTSCAISVIFTPTATGSRTGTLTVTDNSSTGTTQTVQLTGIGQVIAAVTLSPNSLTFGAVNLGTTSAAQVVTLTNSGSAPLTVSGVTIAGDFSQTNNCSADIPAGGTCTFNVTFTPTDFGSRFGTITIVDNAVTSPQTIALSGLTTSMPIPVFSVNSLTFGSQSLSTNSAPQNVFLANGGNVPLTISGIVATGDFGETNNCGTSLAPNAFCTITVTFDPTAAGNRAGLITVTDNATPPTQAVSLTGVGSSFQLSAASSSGVAIPAGQTATFPVTISATAGFTQSVALACTLPTGVGTCTISPKSVSPTVGSPQSATLTVTTVVRNQVPPATGIKIDPLSGLRHFGISWLTWLALVLAVITIAAVRQRPLSASFGFAVVLLMASVACGGAGTAQAPGQASGTPAGTYTVVVTGTAGAVTSSMQFNLQVN